MAMAASASVNLLKLQEKLPSGVMEPRAHPRRVTIDREVNACLHYKSWKKPQGGAGYSSLPTGETLIKLGSPDLAWCLKSNTLATAL